MPYTLDVIYKFIADTKQFEKELKDLEGQSGKVGAGVAAPDYKKVESELRNVNREITRLRDTGQLSVEKAAQLKKEYNQARREVDKMADRLAQMVRQRGQFGSGVKPSGIPVEATLESNYQRMLAESKGGALPPMEDYMAAWDQRFRSSKKGLIDLQTGVKAVDTDIKDFNNNFFNGMNKSTTALETVNAEVVQVEKNAKKGSASLEQLGRALMVKGFSFYGLRLVGASVIQLGQMATMIGGLASAGVFKFASDYIKNAETSNETTREWAKQMERVEGSQQRIGRVLAQQTLPFLEKGAELLGKLADYIERNPEAVNKLIKGGLALTGLGSLLFVVGKGINLVSDTAFIIAAAQMATSGKDNIIAAGMMMRSSQTYATSAAAMVTNMRSQGLGAGAAGAGALGIASSAIFLASTTALAAGITDKVFDKIEKRDVTLAEYMTTAKQGVALMAGGLGWASEKISNIFRMGDSNVSGTAERWFENVAKALGLIEGPAKAATDSLLGLSDVLANSLKRDEALAAFEDYKADDLELLRKYYDDRRKVDIDAQKATLKANQDLANGIAKAYADQVKQLAKVTADYKKDEEKAQQDYQEKRAEILRDAGEQALEDEEKLREKLRKLRLDYEEREAELLAARDAVGLVKNRQKFLRDQAEAQREANKEVAKRREETGKKLAELQHEYEQERAQRLADWQARIKEIQAQTKAEVDELRKKHAEELREIQINRNARLSELHTQLNEERKRRYNAFIATIRDLDAALLGEQNLRKKYQTAMLKELDAFLIAYRNGMKQLQAIPPGRQMGGYVSGGTYRLHDGEYVLNPGTTRALEQIIGGKLTQSAVMQMAGGGRSSVVWNDSRRFDSRLQASDRRMISNDTLELLGSVVGG